MKTERNIFLEVLKRDMDNSNKVNLDYATLLKKARTGDPNFDTFIAYLSEEMRFIDSVNPYSPNPLGSLEEKVDRFLITHAGLNYHDFIRQSKPEEITTDGYVGLPKKTLKRRLFDYRARLYLSALADCEERGLDIGQVLESIKTSIIPFIKKDANEPTYQKILSVLAKKG